MSSGSKIHKSKCLPSSHLLLLGLPNWDTIYFRKPKRAHLKFEMKKGKKRDTKTNIKGCWSLCITCVCEWMPSFNLAHHLDVWVAECREGRIHRIQECLKWPIVILQRLPSTTNPDGGEKKKRGKAWECGGNPHWSMPWGRRHAPIIVLLKQFRATVGLNEDLTNPCLGFNCYSIQLNTFCQC